MARKSFQFAVTCLLICGGGRSAFAQDRIWRPYIELEGRANSIRQVGQGNLFVPLRQDCDSLLFADLRGLWTDGDAGEGNWGLAYRKMTAGDWIVGAHLFYDLRHTEQNNVFHQGTAGVELLNVDWGFRFNGYIPDQGTKAAPGLAGAFLQGGNIVVRQGLEAAYWGVDFEAERLLWRRDACCDCGDCCSSWSLANLDAELWASAGAFHFDNAANGFENITGPRLRAELRLYDLPMLGDDSRLSLSGQYEYDDVRGSVGSGMLTVRIPFGRGGGRSGYRLTGLDRRMVAPIVRDIDIVTNAGPTEPAKIARTGRVISRAVTVDGNTADPEGAIEGAGTNSVVIADGSAGTINTGGTINMNNGQVLMGGGSGLAVIGCNTGTAATFNAPGTRPTVNGTNAANDVFQIANDSMLTGLNVTGGRNGVFGDGVTGFTISNNHISGAMGGALDGNGVRLVGPVRGNVLDNTLSGNARGGFIVEGEFRGTLSNNLSTGNTAFGFNFVDNFGDITNNRAVGNGTFGLGLVDNYGNITNNVLSGNGDFGLTLVDNFNNISNNRSTGNSSFGISFGGNFGSVTNNTMTGNGAFAFGVSSNSGTINNNAAIDNTSFGFSLNNNPTGTFSNNMAIDNGGFGYAVTNNGTAANNTGSGNAGGGDTFP